jgi:hypothetical protein
MAVATKGGRGGGRTCGIEIPRLILSGGWDVGAETYLRENAAWRGRKRDGAEGCPAG